VKNLLDFKERYTEMLEGMELEGMEHLKFVGFISGNPGHDLVICICLDEKKRKAGMAKIGFIHLLYRKDDKESFSMEEFVGLLDFLHNEGCRVVFDLNWLKEEGL